MCRNHCACLLFSSESSWFMHLWLHYLINSVNIKILSLDFFSETTRRRFNRIHAVTSAQPRGSKEENTFECWLFVQNGGRLLLNLIAKVVDWLTELSGGNRDMTAPLPLFSFHFPWCSLLQWLETEQRWSSTLCLLRLSKDGASLCLVKGLCVCVCVCVGGLISDVVHLSPFSLGPDGQTCVCVCVCVWIIYS